LQYCFLHHKTQKPIFYKLIIFEIIMMVFSPMSDKFLRESTYSEIESNSANVWRNRTDGVSARWSDCRNVALNDVSRVLWRRDAAWDDNCLRLEGKRLKFSTSHYSKKCLNDPSIKRIKNVTNKEEALSLVFKALYYSFFHIWPIGIIWWQVCEQCCIYEEY